MTRRYLEATGWLCDQVERVVIEGRLDFPASTFEEMHVGYQVGVDLFEFGGASCYSITNDAARQLVAWTTKTPGYFDAVSQICATNIFEGAPLPDILKTFAGLIVAREIERPKSRHRPRKKNWTELAFLYSLGSTAQRKFDLDLTRNDEAGHSHSACDALAEALTVCGRKTRYSEIKRLYVHPDFARFRQENAIIGEAYRRKENMKRIVDALTSGKAPEGPFARYLADGLGKS